MQESLAPEHSGELFGDALEELLDGGRVADESGGHLQTAGRNVTHGSLQEKKDLFKNVDESTHSFTDEILARSFHALKSTTNN